MRSQRGLSAHSSRFNTPSRRNVPRKHGERHAASAVRQQCVDDADGLEVRVLSDVPLHVRAAGARVPRVRRSTASTMQHGYWLSYSCVLSRTQRVSKYRHGGRRGQHESRAGMAALRLAGASIRRRCARTRVQIHQQDTAAPRVRGAIERDSPADAEKIRLQVRRTQDNMQHCKAICTAQQGAQK